MAQTKIRLPQLNAESLKAADATSLVFKEQGVAAAYLTFDTDTSKIDLGDGAVSVKLSGELTGTSFKTEANMASNSATAVASQQSIKAYVDAHLVDEDNMASDSATKPPSQQSVKAYVDASVTAQDLDFQGDAGGALSIDLDSETLDIAGGTGITTTGSGNEISVALDNTAVTPASYGAVTKVLSATVDQQGRLTAMAHINIAISST